MFIDTFSTHWQHLLDERHERLDNNTQLYLLLDGIFVPDLYRAVQLALGGKRVSLLFERLPSCSDATRAVSPFLLPYRPASAQLARASRMITEGREPFDASSKTYYMWAWAGYLRFRKIYSGWDSVLISKNEASESHDAYMS
jgi:hypothetical protein